MSALKDGGPAFPGDYYSPEAFVALRPAEGVLEAKAQASGKSPGMALRDWFAGQALAGIAANTLDTAYANRLAESAYFLADAMIAERGKP